MRIVAALVVAVAVAVGTGTARADGEAPKVAWEIDVSPPSSDDGTHLAITWRRIGDLAGNPGVLVLRRATGAGASFASMLFDPIDRAGAVLAPRFTFPAAPKGEYHPGISLAKAPVVVGSAVGEWQVIAFLPGDPEAPIVDEVAAGTTYVYAFVPVALGATADTYAQIVNHVATSPEVSGEGAWFHRKRWLHLGLLAIIAGSLFGFTRLAKRKKLFIRRLSGVDAIEDAVGRSTEMGRPILYVTGVEQAQNIETLASLLILGHVAQIAAEYDTELQVANAFPLTMVIAEEIVRQGYANAGRADAHRPENVMFITSEQFAFAAAVNGIIMRDRPATNIYFGKFYAESLMLAETGFLTGAIQIAGTAELTQLPFFVSACDHTLMGEELFACSAYLTREPNQMALVKAGDVMKVVIAVLVVAFTVFATLASQGIVPFTRFSIEDLLP
ncbi:MAG: hypothetical protein NT062_35440 [Proteobacteria bacterium]|nr:hypothetical protein [Pseudomonadota bacterium]